MTSKELNEILNKTRRTPKIELSVEQVEEIINKLEILEILKKQVINDSVIYLKKEDFIDEEDYNKVEEWLDGKD